MEKQDLEKDFLKELKTEHPKEEKSAFQQLFKNENERSEELQKEFLQAYEEPEHCLNHNFRAVLSFYVTKNNVIAGLYDCLERHRLVSGGKDSGGNYTQRGTDKNSSRVMQKILDVYEEYIKELGIDHLTIHLIRGVAQKRSTTTEKNLSKLLLTWKLPEGIFKYPELITNKCRKPHGYPNRRKGGRRGRRV